jgi:hypothetical protein
LGYYLEQVGLAEELAAELGDIEAGLGDIGVEIEDPAAEFGEPAAGQVEPAGARLSKHPVLSLSLPLAILSPELRRRRISPRLDSRWDIDEMKDRDWQRKELKPLYPCCSSSEDRKLT